MVENPEDSRDELIPVHQIEQAEVLGAQLLRTSFASKRSETCLFEFEA
jgi:hypothetical protein